MTPEQLERELPNGFHDAQIRSISIDYVEKTIVMDMRLWIGSLSPPDKGEREAVRDARITLSNILFFVLEPPDPRYLQYQRVSVTSSGPGTPPDRPMSFSGEIPNDVFAYWFYISTWNAFIHFAARDARIEST